MQLFMNALCVCVLFMDIIGYDAFDTINNKEFRRTIAIWSNGKWTQVTLSATDSSKFQFLFLQKMLNSCFDPN